MASPSNLFVVLLFVLQVLVPTAHADGGGGGGETFATFQETFGVIGLHLLGLLVLIFLVHFLVQPNWQTLRLMTKYLEDGARISGTVLDCEKLPSTSTTSENDDKTTSPRWNVDVMWECKEHKFADNPILKARHPDAVEVRRFARVFEFEQEQIVGAFVPILLPHSISTTQQPRSGCPAPVVERILKQERYKEINQSRLILFFGIALIMILIGLTARAIHSRMDYPLAGWVLLVASMAVFESGSYLFCNHQFLKTKASVFDGARSMISAGV